MDSVQTPTRTQLARDAFMIAEDAMCKGNVEHWLRMKRRWLELTTFNPEEIEVSPTFHKLLCLHVQWQQRRVDLFGQTHLPPLRSDVAFMLIPVVSVADDDLIYAEPAEPEPVVVGK